MRNPGRIISIGHGNNIGHRTRTCLNGLIGKIFDFDQISA